jgi:hypothetical protein
MWDINLFIPFEQKLDGFKRKASQGNFPWLAQGCEGG